VNRFHEARLASKDQEFSIERLKANWRRARQCLIPSYYLQQLRQLASWSSPPAGLDEGLLSLSLSNLLYMDNPYSYKKFQ
jgi:hypothetical protein